MLGALDPELVGEASSFVDDAQNALAQVSQLADLLANTPSFGNPTEKLPAMLDAFKPAAGGAATALAGSRDLFGPEG